MGWPDETVIAVFFIEKPEACSENMGCSHPLISLFWTGVGAFKHHAGQCGQAVLVIDGYVFFENARNSEVCWLI